MKVLVPLLLAVAFAYPVGVIIMSTQTEVSQQDTTLDRVRTVGTHLTTTEGLDCYGDEIGAARFIASRTQGEDIAANDVRIAELARSQGYTLDAHQPYVVTVVDGQYVKVRVIGGDFDRFECWLYGRDAALLSR